MPDLKIQSLEANRLANAYPLIRSATRVSRQRWEAFGRQLIDDGGGILTVIAPDGCIHGVAAYRAALNLRYDRSLDVEVLVAFELRGDGRVRELLCNALEGIAAILECRTINVTLAASYGAPTRRSRAALERLGLKLGTVNFVRELEKR